MEDRVLKQIRNLVGDVSYYDLRYVDYYVCDSLGIFIPSVGFCEYATTPNHTHPTYSFIIYLSRELQLKECDIGVGEEDYLVTAISPDIPHEEEKTDSFKRYIAILISKELFNTQYLFYDLGQPKEYNWKHFAVDGSIMQLINRFMEQFETELPGKDKVLEALSILITHQLIRGMTGKVFGTEIYEGRLEIEKVIVHMNQYFGQRLTLKEMAKVANISESHLLRIFKKETDMSPLEYLIKLRIEKAKKLLRDSSLRITEISFQCGFNSPSSFSSCFAKHTGIAPSEYQKRNSLCL